MVSERDLPERLLTAREAADILGVHINTLKRWPVPFYRIGPRGDRRYELRDILALKVPA